MNILINLRQKKKLTVKHTSIITAIVCLSLASFTLQQTEWTAPESAKSIKNPIPADAASIAAGKVLYTKECLQCHGKKGLGDGPNSTTLDKSPAPINNTAKVKNQTDGELFWKIKEGRKPMPSTKKNFTDEQRWKVVNYIRTLSK
jgi:mono/diheme cytochrome c family protein